MTEGEAVFTVCYHKFSYLCPLSFNALYESRKTYDVKMKTVSLVDTSLALCPIIRVVIPSLKRGLQRQQFVRFIEVV